MVLCIGGHKAHVEFNFDVWHKIYFQFGKLIVEYKGTKTYVDTFVILFPAFRWMFNVTYICQEWLRLFWLLIYKIVLCLNYDENKCIPIQLQQSSLQQ